MKISGKFSANLNPLDCFANGCDGATLGRMSINKTFEGELSAESTGEMFSALTSVEGSAGYVAIEQVVGNLSGKTGSFILQHYGIMAKGESSLTLEVVPDSGAGDLVGISGAMDIRIEEGQHFYDFDYEL